MIKKIIIFLFTITGLAVVGMNLRHTCREIGWNCSDGGYSEFLAMKSRCDRVSVVSFLQKHLQPGKSCYFWTDPQDDDLVSIECLIADIDYYLFPLSVKYGPQYLKSGTDYIITEKANYEDLKLFMVFYDLDEKYAIIAENEKMIMLRVR